MYGLDADLIMLALASHEPRFCLLREEITFGRELTEDNKRRLGERAEKTKFQLFHISLLREYLDLEFFSASPYYDIERVIDDFVLVCAMVGNDFLPHLPFFDISGGGLAKLFVCYKEYVAALPEEREEGVDP